MPIDAPTPPPSPDSRPFKRLTPVVTAGKLASRFIPAAPPTGPSPHARMRDGRIAVCQVATGCSPARPAPVPLLTRACAMAALVWVTGEIREVNRVG